MSHAASQIWIPTQTEGAFIKNFIADIANDLIYVYGFNRFPKC